MKRKINYKGVAILTGIVIGISLFVIGFNGFFGRFFGEEQSPSYVTITDTNNEERHEHHARDYDTNQGDIAEEEVESGQSYEQEETYDEDEQPAELNLNSPEVVERFIREYFTFHAEETIEQIESARDYMTEELRENLMAAAHDDIHDHHGHHHVEASIFEVRDIEVFAGDGNNSYAALFTVENEEAHTGSRLLLNYTVIVQVENGRVNNFTIHSITNALSFQI